MKGINYKSSWIQRKHTRSNKEKHYCEFNCQRDVVDEYGGRASKFVMGTNDS